MRSDRFERLSALFGEALDLEGPARRAFVERSCAGDDELRQRLEDMLAADGLDDDFIAPPAPPAGVLPPRDDGTPDELVGTRVGPWQLDAPLGSGGMGDVYAASRADGRFEMRVAVKVLKRGLDTDELVRRFHRERQALGALEHPGIARLVDAGSVPDGRPCLVVEHVDGEPIDAYCQRQRLDLAARVRLFREVCRAVSHAHNHLVLHCDLKPANVLVTAEGRPKLLDFGIAKLLDADGPALTATHAPRPMTLEYASPEGVRGERLGVTSDVYALGVVLYELLTGSSPYRYETRADLVHQITGTTPPRPSTAWLGRGPQERGGRGVLRLRRLGSDLDTVVLMALRKEPERRYATVEQFSDDLGRFLDGHPVRARPATWRYVGWRFLTRHRWGVLAAAAVLASLTAGVLGLSWRAEETRVERDRALDAQQHAQLVSGFLEDVLASPGPDRLGRQGSLRDVLEFASDELDGGRFADRPLVEASVRSVVGRTWLTLGQLPEAEQHLRRALALRETHAADNPGLLASSLDELGQLLFARHDTDDALALFERSLELWRRAAGERSVEVAQALNNCGATLNAAAEPDRAETRLDAALALRGELLGDDHVAVAETLTNLGSCYRQRGELERNEAALREALRIRLAAFGPDHHLVGQSLSNLAVNAMHAGRLDDAAELLTRSLDVQRRVLGDDHPELATGLSNLGSLHQLRGAYPAARRALQECVDVRRRALPAGSDPVLAAEVRLGVVLVVLGDLTAAEPLLIPGAERFADDLGLDDQQAHNVLECLARLYEGTDRGALGRDVRRRMADHPPVR